MVVSQNLSSATSLAMLAPIRTLTSTCSFSRMMSDMSWIPSGPSLRPWTGETVKRISQIFWPGRRIAMTSLWWARFRWPLLPGVLSSGRTGCRWTGEGWRKRWPSPLWRPPRCLGPRAGGNRAKTALNRRKTRTLLGRSLTTKAHGTTWAQLYRRAPVAHKQTKSITYWRKYPLKQPDLNTHHVLGQFVARQIFDVLMLCVYDLCQLTALNDLLINPHVDHRVEAVGRFDVVPDDFGDGRTPEGEEGWNISYFWFAAVA